MLDIGPEDFARADLAQKAKDRERISIEYSISHDELIWWFEEDFSASREYAADIAWEVEQLGELIAQFVVDFEKKLPDDAINTAHQPGQQRPVRYSKTDMVDMVCEAMESAMHSRAARLMHATAHLRLRDL